MTRYQVSAFGVIHKSESEPGKYKPITQMSRGERADTRDSVRRQKQIGDIGRHNIYSWHNGTEGVRRSPRRTAVERAPKASAHGLEDTFKQYGYTRRHADDIENSAGSGKQLKQDFDVTRHRPSTVHPNISYGHSITAKMEAGLDKTIDPKISAGLKHRVVLHHDTSLHPNIMAAAIPAHPLTGGRGHVVLGAPFTPGWKAPRGAGTPRRAIVNHELAHASLKHQPIQSSVPAKNIGEEARADAQSGANAYTRNHVVAGRRTTALLSHLPADKKELIPQIGTSVAYHRVRGLIRAGTKVR